MKRMLIIFVLFAALSCTTKNINSNCAELSRSPSGKSIPENPPLPIKVVDGNAFYSDKQGSKIDPELYKDNEQSRKPLRNYLDDIIRLSDASFYDVNSSKTLDHWLGVWANADALSVVTSQQAGFERKWILTGLSISFWRTSPHTGWNNTEVINLWLHRLTLEMMKDYSSFEKNSQKNNHVYWAGLAALVAGINSNDKAMMNWGVEKIRFGISEVSQEGFLPLELSRGSRALQYHRVSLDALMMATYFAKSQGIDLLTESNGALLRLSDKVIEGYEDPEIFAKKAGVKQEFELKGSTAWLVIYNSLKPGNAKVEELLSKVPPQGNRFLGGDVSRVVGISRIVGSCKGIL